MKTVLVVDDEENIRETLKDILEDDGYSVLLARNGREALDVVGFNVVDVVLLDLWLPEMGGMDVLRKMKEVEIDLPVIIISGHGTIDLAVQATKMGAFDFLEKPLSTERVLKVVDHAIKISRLNRENLALRQRNQNIFYMVRGVSRAFREIEEIIENCAWSNSRVFITGENGTGKEVVARTIHLKSPRREGPFVAVNCAAIPHTLIEAELFGYQRGAFTGAVSDKKGKFEIATGGTIFLDEVADMSLAAQAKVLRVLEEMQIERIGGVAPIKIDVRVIAATNKDIINEIQEGRFREDLYYRLNVVPIKVPPLRERREDIPELIEYYLSYFAEESSRKKKVMTEEALTFLTEVYTWPGNIRELKNLIERLIILTKTETITLRDVERNFPGPLELEADFFRKFEPQNNLDLKKAREWFERRYIINVLRENDYNIAKTANVLKVERSNLYKLLKRLGIEYGKG
jgi:two-component system nitrogen regulation response regulator NtrX